VFEYIYRSIICLLIVPTIARVEQNNADIESLHFILRVICRINAPWSISIDHRTCRRISFLTYMICVFLYQLIEALISYYKKVIHS